MADNTFNKDQLSGWYSKYLGRTPSADELAAWEKDYTGKPLTEDFFKQAATGEVGSNNTLYPQSDINQAGYTPGNKPINLEEYITNQYNAKMPQIESDIRGTAAGGGLDTGGYLTSLAKAKTASWSDMLATIVGAKQAQQSFDWQKQLPFIQREWQKEDLNKNYQLQSAQLAANQPDAWQYILGGAAAGSAFGPVGALVGGLAGWGAKQGFFGG